MKFALTVEGLYAVLICFFVAMGCLLALIFKKKDDLSTVKSLGVQFVGLVFGSLILCALYLAWGWNKWVVWILGIPAGLYSARTLRLIFEQAENSGTLLELIENTYKAYKAAKNQGNPPQS